MTNSHYIQSLEIYTMVFWYLSTLHVIWLSCRIKFIFLWWVEEFGLCMALVSRPLHLNGNLKLFVLFFLQKTAGTISECMLFVTSKRWPCIHIFAAALSSANELPYNVTKHSCVFFCWPVISHDYCHIHCSASICLDVKKDIKCPFSSQMFLQVKPI